MLNITMYHFDFNWGDMFNPLKAYNRTSETAGSLLGILLADQLEKKLSENNKNNLVLKNNIRGDVVVVQRNSHIMIDNQDTKFQFKSYDHEDHTILVKSGKLEFEYDLSTVQVLTLVLRPKNQSVGRKFGASVASVLGGAVGFGLGHAVGVSTSEYYNGGHAIMGCTIGMAAAPAVYLASGEDQLLEISFDEWSVQ